MMGQGAMKRIAFLILCAGLAACGADGEPVQPTVATSVTVGTNGVSTSTGVAVRKGPLTLGLSL